MMTYCDVSLRIVVLQWAVLDKVQQSTNKNIKIENELIILLKVLIVKNHDLKTKFKNYLNCA